MSPNGKNLGAKRVGSDEKHWVDVVIDYRRSLAAVAILVTVILAFFAPRLQTEPSLKLVLVTSSPQYQEYETFLESFGNDEFLVAVVTYPQQASDQRVLKSLAALTSQIEKIDNVTQALSLANLKFFRKKEDKVGMFPVLQMQDGFIHFPSLEELKELRTALPLSDLLLSQDLRTVGVVVRLDDRVKYDPRSVRKITGSIAAAAESNLLPGSVYRLVGSHVIRQAIKTYAIKTAVIFGVLCIIISLLVTIYVFKNFTISCIALFIICLSIVSVLGLMAVMEIPLSATTSMAFGLIIITTTLEMVIHIVVRYHQFRRLVDDRVEAARQAIRYLVRPFIMCSATTAVGFGACIVSQVPVVAHLGVLMPVGIFAAWCLSIVLTPYLILISKSVDAVADRGVLQNTRSPLVEKVSAVIARYYKGFVVGA